MTDPIDDTQPHPSPSDGTDAGSATAAPPAGAAPPAAIEPAGEPPLRADPDRPADSGWREPAWFPPDRGGRRDRDRRPSVVAMVVGLAFIAVGLYYFLDRTLGVAMPRIQWSSLWPVVLIVLGVLVLLRSFQRNA